MSEHFCVVTNPDTPIGQAIVEELLRRNVRVLGVTRRQSDSKVGGLMVSAQADPADYLELKATVQAAEQNYGPIDGFVNNVELVPETPGAHKLQDPRGELNLLSIFNGTQVALKAMRSRGKGTIVNVSPLSGIKDYFNLLYHPSRHQSPAALKSFCSKASGVRCVTVAPSGNKHLYSEFLLNEKGGVDLKKAKMVMPKDIARAVWLAYSRSSNISFDKLVISPAGLH
jgi:NADP-dependent 3-hydroxy acid dehydrogenase YdfG